MLSLHQTQTPPSLSSSSFARFLLWHCLLFLLILFLIILILSLLFFELWMVLLVFCHGDFERGKVLLKCGFVWLPGSFSQRLPLSASNFGNSGNLGFACRKRCKYLGAVLCDVNAVTATGWLLRGIGVFLLLAAH